ncbi:GNAT family N-acetyltransferase [Candidatus Thorarchaeota archaeon]|nr:MAG: GNAT family N-acetyltransferase [Candidatus Thorarchaeota archaeon]
MPTYHYDWLKVPEGFEFGLAETDAEIDEVVHFNTEIFGPAYGEFLKRLVENLPGFKSEMNSFIRDADSGRIVSSVVAFPSDWSYDGIIIRNLELVFLGTAEAYRNRGLFNVLYTYLDRLIREGEYEISSVQGVPYFYRKYGYDLIIPTSYNCPINLPIGNIPVLKSESEPEFMNIAIRSAEDSDFDILMILLQETNQKSLVSAVRSRELWRIQERLRMEISWNFDTFVLEKNGIVDGYFRLLEYGSMSQTNSLVVPESSIRSYDSTMRTLYFIKALAEEKGVRTLKVPGHLSSNLGKLALDYGGTHNLMWKHQIRVPDLTRFLNKIRPVLEKRLKGTMFENLTKEIFLNTYRSCHRLKFVNGSLDPIENIGAQPPNTYVELCFPPDSFKALMFGDSSLSELKKQNLEISIGRGYRELFETLFPTRESFIYHYHC